MRAQRTGALERVPVFGVGGGWWAGAESRWAVCHVSVTLCYDEAGLVWVTTVARSGSGGGRERLLLNETTQIACLFVFPSRICVVVLDNAGVGRLAEHVSDLRCCATPTTKAKKKKRTTVAYRHDNV